MQVNEEKRKKFMEFAGKRVNNVLHDIQILEPMSRSNSYDFTKQDVDEMFHAIQETLDNTRAEFERKFEEKVRNEKKVFSFGATTYSSTSTTAETNTDSTWTTTQTNTTDTTTTSTTDTSSNVTENSTVTENITF